MATAAVAGAAAVATRWLGALQPFARVADLQRLATLQCIIILTFARPAFEVRSAHTLAFTD